MRVTPHILVACLVLTGCQFTPSPTTKLVATNDVIGVWSFAEDYGKTTVFMTFMPSGVFTQEVVTASQTNVQVGSWSLDGPHIQLTDFYGQFEGTWKSGSIGWYFIDGDKRELEIFGGVFPDPDAYQHLSYLRAPL